VLGPWREATVPGSARAAGNPHFDLPDHRRLRAANPAAPSHSHASSVRRLSLYGRGLAQGSAVLRSHTYHVHAGQVPAGLYVPAPGELPFQGP